MRKLFTHSLISLIAFLGISKILGRKKLATRRSCDVSLKWDSIIKIDFCFYSHYPVHCNPYHHISITWNISKTYILMNNSIKCYERWWVIFFDGETTRNHWNKSLVLFLREFQKHTKLVFIGRVIKPSLLARYQVSTS